MRVGFVKKEVGVPRLGVPGASHERLSSKNPTTEAPIGFDVGEKM